MRVVVGSAALPQRVWIDSHSLVRDWERKRTGKHITIWGRIAELGARTPPLRSGVSGARGGGAMDRKALYAMYQSR